ncbi:MAG: methylmalonyl-CoA mutase [Bacteroidetes bacterium HGW-Bacteroidetes-2]|jgi:methylmalonyl-CoA mutase|nr:MAG: methylmalonyl-CoA mutase [Bacteroidetes bacterium HGW-Bacteroidetes-8]PKP26767.1 MAG: methylmalonyl-CoA mutase [Bacteroidetes bacterium HGW-Bacteroidetes-2]
MNKFLFKEFDGVSAKAWKQKIQAELNGVDYNKSLVWKNSEGIDVTPFYHQDEIKEPFTPIPGQPKNWIICQTIFVDDVKIANHIALDAIHCGADAIQFSAIKEFSLEALFKGMDLSKTNFYFQFQFLSKDFIDSLNEFFKNKNATFFLNVDIIGNLIKEGNWYFNFKQDHQIIEDIIKNTTSTKNILSVDTSIYQNAGATMVQQLAYALAHANEYLNHLNCNSIYKDISLTFQVAVGSNYFFEIAKLRALRKLYAALAKEYGFSENCHLFVTPSKRNKTLYDYNVNMLRTTTECMSAILGSADTVCNLPYDALYHKSNEFGERISRNQLLILKKESYLDRVTNPADGSYYIESITNQLAEKALTLFKELEKAGGILILLKEGKLQTKIKESALKEQNQFDDGKKILLGTNKHPNKNDRMKDNLELYPFVKTKPRKTLIEPIIERRLAEKVEQERLEKE